MNRKLLKVIERTKKEKKKNRTPSVQSSRTRNVTRQRAYRKEFECFPRLVVDKSLVYGYRKEERVIGVKQHHHLPPASLVLSTPCRLMDSWISLDQVSTSCAGDDAGEGDVTPFWDWSWCMVPKLTGDGGGARTPLRPAQ